MKPRLAANKFFFLSILLLIQCKLFSRFSGGQPAQFLNFGANARTFGVGKAFFAISDDSNAAYFNQAGLGLIERAEISALHAGLLELFPDTKTQYDYLSFVYPTIKLGTFGLALVRLHSSDFKKVEVKHYQTTGEIELIEGAPFEVSEFAANFSYGKTIYENISLGGAIKYISRTVDYHTDGFISFDVSAMYEGIIQKLPSLRLAAGIRNLFSSGFAIGRVKGSTDKIPIILRFGLSSKFLKDRLTVAIDFEKNIRANPNFYIGAEYWLIDFVCLRCGFDGEMGIRETSLGLGIKYKDYAIDYALALHELGLSHRISATWKFGRPVGARRTALIETLSKEIEEYVSRGNFLYALKKAEELLKVDPKDKMVQKLVAKLQQVVAFIPAATEDTDMHQSIRRAIEAYLQDDIPGTINILKYVYFKDPDNLKLLGLLNTLEKQAGLIPTERYREEIPGWTIIDKKIYEARQAMLQNRPEQALMICQEILTLEPKNITALEIMGSAFFLMNQFEQAIRIWEQVMKLDPTNKVVPEFIEEAKRLMLE